MKQVSEPTSPKAEYLSGDRQNDQFDDSKDLNEGVLDGSRHGKYDDDDDEGIANYVTIPLESFVSM